MSVQRARVHPRERHLSCRHHAATQSLPMLVSCSIPLVGCLSCGSHQLVTARSVHSLECACLTRRKRPPSSCLPYHVSSHCFGLGFLGKHVFAHSTSFPASSCCFLPLSYGPRSVPDLSCSIMCNTRINHRISGILGLPTRNHPLLKKYIRQCHRLAASQLHMPDPTYDMST